MKADFHVHSEFSDDSATPMEAQVERAVELGFDELCFTDHVDYGVKRDWDDPREAPVRDGKPLRNVDYPRYFEKLGEMRRRYGGQITIRRGLEFGMQQHTIPQFEALFERCRDRLDFILLSVHQVEDRELWTREFQSGRTQEEYHLRYYEELLALTRRFEHFSVLAHLDLIRRYDPAGEYPFAKTRDIVAEILRAAIEKGKGIELNTSSWHYGLADTQPSRDVLRLYRDLGGEVLTIGSDGHAPRWLGDHWDEGRAILRDGLGFRRFCTFEGMKPLFHEL